MFAAQSASILCCVRFYVNYDVYQDFIKTPNLDLYNIYFVASPQNKTRNTKKWRMQNASQI